MCIVLGPPLETIGIIPYRMTEILIRAIVGRDAALKVRVIDIIDQLGDPSHGNVARDYHAIPIIRVVEDKDLAVRKEIPEMLSSSSSDEKGLRIFSVLYDRNKSLIGRYPHDSVLHFCCRLQDRASGCI
jgi:hypothetical protein